MPIKYQFKNNCRISICKGCYFCATEFADKWAVRNGIEEFKGSVRVYCQLTDKDLSKHDLFKLKPDDCPLQEVE